jgi:hypothetical protein
MKNGKTIAGIILVFLLGGGSGALTMHMVAKQKMEAFIHNGQQSRVEIVTQRLTKKLDLDERQRLEVQRVVRETHAEIRAARRQIRPQVEIILARSHDRINALLTPDQQKKYARIIGERHSAFDREEK